MERLGIDIGSNSKSSVKLSLAQPAKRRRGSNTGRPLRLVELSANVIALFQNKVQKTPTCWLWTGRVERHGYGVAYTGKRPNDRAMCHYAHRVAYAIAFGEVPDRSVVMHSCDVPNCVNPAHLRVGTQGDNCRDRTAKGRDAKEKVTNRKIDAAGVREIRQRRDIPSAEFARRFGVCVSHINRIRRFDKRKVS